MNLNTCSFQDWAKEFNKSPEREKAACRGDGFWWFDSSILNDYRHCPRYAFLRHGLCRAEGPHNSTAMDFGDFIHQALAIFHTTGNIEEALKLVMLFPVTWADEIRTPELFVKILRAYHKRFGHDLILKVKPEGSFAMPVMFGKLQDQDDTPRDPVLYTGRLDMPMVEYNGELWGVEHKTTTYWIASNTQALSASSQVKGYMYALSLYYPETKGMLMNLIRVAKTGQDFQRIRIKKSHWILEEWYSSMLYDVLRILKSFETGNWPQWWTCYYYNRLCGYHDICCMDTVSLMLDQLKGKPTTTWRPYERLKSRNQGSTMTFKVRPEGDVKHG